LPQNPYIIFLHNTSLQGTFENPGLEKQNPPGLFAEPGPLWPGFERLSLV
jgi:hypothetical protein